MIRKLSGIMISLLAVSVILPSSAEAVIGIRIKVTGGMSYISYGHFNEYADYFNDALGEVGIDEGISNINWIPEMGGEVTVTLYPYLSAGVGIGILYGRSKASFYYQEYDFSYEYKHSVLVVPLTITGYFRPSLPSSPIRPYISGGIGLYPSWIKFDENNVDPSEELALDAALSKWGFGMHGSAGLELPLKPAISFELGVKWRWAKVKGFEGTATEVSSKTGTEGGDVFLAYDDDEDHTYYGPEYLEYKKGIDEGELDLGGLGLYLGLSVEF